MEKSPSQLEAELKTLGAQATSNLYRRMEIAATLLADAEWLAAHDASLDKGEAYLADLYFVEFRGLIDFAKLHMLYRKYDRLVWEKYRFDVAAIESLYDEDYAKEKESRTRKSYKKQADELSDQLSESKAQLATVRRVEASQTETISSLSERVRELERENAELRGRIQELERITRRELAA